MGSIENNTNIPDSISQMIDDIRYMLDETGEIIFIECLGTPGSDKTQYTKYLADLLRKGKMKEYVIRRKDPEKHIPIEITEESETLENLHDKDYYTNLLKERFATVISDLNKHSKIIIYDRGLLDFIVWLNYDYSRVIMDSDEYYENGGDALNDDFLLKTLPIHLRKQIAKPDRKRPMASEELNKLLNVYSPISVVFDDSPFEEETDGEMYSDIDIECYNDSLEYLLGSIKDASQKCIYITNFGNENKSREEITFKVLKSIRDYLKLQVPKSPGKYIPFPEDPYPDDEYFH